MLQTISTSVNQYQSMLMSSREMATLTETRHDNVKRAIDTMVQKGVIANPQIEGYLDAAGRSGQTEYLVGKRDSYVVVAQLSPEFTGRLVDRWQELEGRPRVPQDFAQAMRLAADEYEKRIALEHQVALNAPKVEFADAVVQQAEEMSITAAWKHFNLSAMKRKDFIDLLIAAKAVIRRKYFDGRPEFIEATAPMVSGGYLRVIESPDERGVPRKQTVVTGKGLDHIHKLLKARGLLA